jgi:hypothetical protein
MTYQGHHFQPPPPQPIFHDGQLAHGFMLPAHGFMHPGQFIFHTPPPHAFEPSQSVPGYGVLVEMQPAAQQVRVYTYSILHGLWIQK